VVPVNDCADATSQCERGSAYRTSDEQPRLGDEISRLRAERDFLRLEIDLAKGQLRRVQQELDRTRSLHASVDWDQPVLYAVAPIGEVPAESEAARFSGSSPNEQGPVNIYRVHSSSTGGLVDLIV